MGKCQRFIAQSIFDSYFRGVGVETASHSRTSATEMPNLFPDDLLGFSRKSVVGGLELVYRPGSSLDTPLTDIVPSSVRILLFGERIEWRKDHRP